MPLSDSGLQAGQPTVLTGNATTAYRPGRVVLTDGLRRREMSTRCQPAGHLGHARAGRPAARWRVPDRDFLPFGGDEHQSHARLIGARDIRASSSASDPDSFGGSVHSDQPYSAFDGDPQTAWRSNPFLEAPANGWRSTSARRATVDSVQRPLHPPTRRPIRSVTTEAGTATHGRCPDTDTVALHVVRWPHALRPADVTGVTAPGGPFHQVGVTELPSRRTTVQRTIVMPQDLRAGTAVRGDMSAPDDARNGCALVGSVRTAPSGSRGSARRAPAWTGRSSLPSPGSYALSLTADAACRRRRSTALLRSATGPKSSQTASSQAIAAPLAGPQAAVDA